jgi:NAD(P) transhydrogenase
MVEGMRAGSVVVDLAAEAGGNCELTVPGAATNVDGRIIIGYSDLPSRLPAQSSTLFSNNVVNLFLSMAKPKGTYVLDPTDPVVRSVNVVRDGANLWPTPVPPPPAPPPPKPAAVAHGAAAPEDPWAAAVRTSALATAGLGSIVGLSLLGPTAASSSMVTKFALAGLAGYQSVWSVKPALHSPLMSVTNAISGCVLWRITHNVVPPN